MSRASILLLSALLALLAFAPATAMAKPKGKPKAATFRLEISGEQLTTWSYSKVMEPSCDFPEFGSGRQYIEFGTYPSGPTARPKVKIKPAKGDTISWDFARDDIAMLADADMEAERHTLYSQITPCEPGQGPFGGDDPPVDVHDSPRCRQVGEIDIALGTSAEDIYDESYPTGLEDAKAPKSPLYFVGIPAWFSDASDHNLPAACAEDGSFGADIGVVESQGEWAGGIIAAGSSLSAKKLLGSKKKRTEVEFSRTVSYPNDVQTYGGPPTTRGKTTMNATFTFTRVGR